MKKFLLLTAIILMILSLGACKTKKNDTHTDQPVVKVYYINSKTTSMVSEEYELIATEKNEQIEELLYMLKKGPDNMLYKSTMPENVTVKEFLFNEDQSLTINFESSYNELKGISEVLCRAAIVKTLCQLQGVDYIEFNVNGKPLMDSNGNYVGLLTKDDFIDSTGTETKVKLYFANEAGDALVEYVKDITYGGTGSLEELVLEELIKGPSEVGMNRTIPEGTGILDVNTKEGVCYVDFNEKFLNKLPDISDEITIYSVVNTLVELPNINKVQFMINDKIEKTFHEETSFDLLFERNLSLIDNGD